MIGVSNNYWIGRVENQFDPLKRGRVQVRIFGIHSESNIRNDDTGQGIPIEDLPWAQCIMPLTFGGIQSKGTVSPPGVLPGAWVFGISLDGDSYNELFVLGVIPVGVMSDIATNPFEAAANALTNMKDTLTGKPLEFLATDTCKDKFVKVIEDIESGSSGNNNLRSSAACYGVMQLKASYAADHFKMALQNPELRSKIEASTGLNMNPSEVESKLKSDITFNRILGEGVYTHHLSKYQDPVIASLAYNQGAGACNKYLSKYGDPRKGELTYDELANKLIADGHVEAGNYVKKFLKRMGNGSDPCLSNWKK